jgi:hypothetical protein
MELVKHLEALGYTHGSRVTDPTVRYEENADNEWCKLFSR